MNADSIIPLIGVSTFLLVALPFGYALGRRINRNYIIREEARPKTESERLAELLPGMASAGSVLQEATAERIEKERRRNKRDYIFFGAGVLATAVLTLIVQALFS